MMADYNVAVIKGDLNGITVSNAALEVAEAARPLMTKGINHTSLPYNADYFLKNNIFISIF